MKKTLLAAALALVAAPAAAHIVLEKKTADAGSYYKAVFMVGHGCTGGSPTVAVTVRIPPEVTGIKPSPKPGWTMTVKREPVDKPYEYYGRTISDRVAEVTWRGGPLAFDHYDEFVMLSVLPKTPGKVYFKVRQECEAGAMEWADVPAAGKTRRDYKTPAAELDVLPKAEAAPAPEAHKHH